MKLNGHICSELERFMESREDLIDLRFLFRCRDCGSIFELSPKQLSPIPMAGRCRRCGRFLIDEEQKTGHDCKPIFQGVKTLLFEWLHVGPNDGVVEDNGDRVFSGSSLNGWQYRLVVCKHNPPHGEVKFNNNPLISPKEAA